MQNLFNINLPLPPCLMDGLGFPSGQNKCVFLDSDLKPLPLLQSRALLTFKAGIPWENSQEILLV